MVKEDLEERLEKLQRENEILMEDREYHKVIESNKKQLREGYFGIFLGGIGSLAYSYMGLFEAMKDKPSYLLTGVGGLMSVACGVIMYMGARTAYDSSKYIRELEKKQEKLR